MSEFGIPNGPQLNPLVLATAAINDKYTALNGAPGAKVGSIESVDGGSGFVQRYEGSAIYWHKAHGAYWVLGGIYSKYGALGGPTGFLGYPLTDETATADGVGRFTHFVGGSIYWHPSIGAYEVHGAIRECWQRNGSEAFGYPVTDETPTASGRGRVNHFRRYGPDGPAPDGSIYWSPATGAHVIYGGIKSRWLELGEEGSYLGLPITDELPWTDPDDNRSGRINHFERGAIAWTADDSKTVEFPARRVFRSGHIGVSSVGGWAELILTSAGTFQFRGHLHNSGFVGLHCTVATAVGIPGTDKAVAARHEANAGGTTSLDSRDEDWDQSGTNPEIRTNWDALATATQVKTTIEATLGGWEVVTLVLLPAVGALALIALVSGPPQDTVCSYTAGSHMVTDGNNRTLVEPDGVRCRRP